MTFCTSYRVGLMAAALLVFSASPLSYSVHAAEPLRITGPDGQTRQPNRQYGPTTGADTFWGIAQKMRPDKSVSVYQVMAAIYEANPHAFSNNNYNSLERGMILLIPSKEVMASFPKAAAKQRAERDDGQTGRNTAAAPLQAMTRTTRVDAITKDVQAESEAATQTPAATATHEPEARPAKVQIAPAVANQGKPNTEVNQELVSRLEAADSKNLSLTDELARLQDEMLVRGTDIETLQGQVTTLEQRIAELEQALTASKELNAQLQTENDDLKQQNAAASEPAAPANTWRTLMDSPWLLALGAIIPALLLLGLVFWWLGRRRERPIAEAGMGAPVAMTATAAAAGAMAATGAAEASVHLDTDDEDPIDSLLEVGSFDSAHEMKLDPLDEPDMDADIFIDTGEDGLFAEDEGQSLDDLWAEAMGEQEEADAAEPDDADDLDALLAGLDADVGIDNQAVAEVEADSQAETAAAHDLDMELGTLFDELDGAEDSPDAIDVQLGDAEPDPEVANEDLDALLTGLAPATEPAAAEVSEQKKQAPEPLEFDSSELSDAIAAELETDVVLDEAEDLDALLAGLAPAAEAEASAQESGQQPRSPEPLEFDSSELSDAIAAELATDVVLDEDEDLDALLAGLAPAAVESTTAEPVATEPAAEASEQESGQQSLAPEPLEFDSSELSDAIAAELATDVVLDEEEDLDALLAEFGAESETQASLVEDAAVADFAALDEPIETLQTAEDADLKALLAQFDVPEQELPDEDSDFDIETELNATFAQMDEVKDAASPAVSAKAKESGFFKDLKANKAKEAPVLEWESALEPTLSAAQDDEIDISDDNLLAAFAGNSELGSDLDSDLDYDEALAPEDSFAAMGESSLTVDEALAALDARESTKSRTSDEQHEDSLASFQKENGFIDIDKLLNESDDELSDTDLYKDVSVEMGEVEALLGNTPMIDVDDEENAVNAKLDLARAYIEIEDKDSAKALLGEVQLDGNPRQQEEAASLLKNLA
ncbi:hypothetical protein LZP73_11635 [Shewanella sp. AS16]|uniref:FimV/HubP family polar landmark protein n=1 Tax=Shewanella sp. AS16 TaxID=2907625 RepID=UPI001F2AB4DE|nr:FimV/HubP family polar landmark protein [Shewanella sp. AS16]MCE9686844.1 hypothetical protein [Shewanella sp. AS16]